MEVVIEHPIEPELAGPTPRSVRLPWRTRALLAMAGVMALLLFLGGARALLEAGRLAWVGALGRTAAARVTAIRTEPGAAGRPARPTGLWYAYVDPFDGTRVSQFVRLNPGPAPDPEEPTPRQQTTAEPPEAPAVHVGDLLPLRIAHWGGRRVVYFWRPAPWGKGIFLALCGLVVTGVSLGLIRTLTRWRRHRALLLTQGQAVVGTIIHKHADVGDTPRYYLRYGYATVAAGEKLEHEEQVAQEQWKRFEIGQPVTVLYDPAQPAQAGLYALMKHG